MISAQNGLEVGQPLYPLENTTTLVKKFGYTAQANRLYYALYYQMLF